MEKKREENCFDRIIIKLAGLTTCEGQRPPMDLRCVYSLHFIYYAR